MTCSYNARPIGLTGRAGVCSYVRDEGNRPLLVFRYPLSAVIRSDRDSTCIILAGITAIQFWVCKTGYFLLVVYSYREDPGVSVPRTFSCRISIRVIAWRLSLSIPQWNVDLERPYIVDAGKKKPPWISSNSIAEHRISLRRPRRSAPVATPPAGLWRNVSWTICRF